MSDETHEQIIEHRSVFTVDDALVVTTISETDTPVCGTCWRYVQHDDEQQTTEYVRVAWPCEVARLRERAAALESSQTDHVTISAILSDVCDTEQEDPDHPDAIIVHYDTLKQILERWVVHGGSEPPLAQADETGGAR